MLKDFMRVCKSLGLVLGSWIICSILLMEKKGVFLMMGFLGRMKIGARMKIKKPTTATKANIAHMKISANLTIGVLFDGVG